MSFHRSGTILKIATQMSQSIAMQLEQMGLFIQIGEDILDWGDTMRNAEAITVVNPAFDPDYCPIDRSNSFWISVVDGSDTIVGCVASKKMVTDDYIDEIRKGRLWQGRNPDPNCSVNIVLPNSAPKISGTVAYHGGLWFHPKVRGMGLAYLVSRLSRAVAVRRFHADWDCGFVFEGLGKANIPTRVYGYTNCMFAVDGWVPLTNKHEKLYLPWDSRAEWARASLNWMHARVGPANEQLVDNVAFR